MVSTRVATKGFKVQKLEINILETWGDYYYVGLNGLEVLDNNMQPIKLTSDMVDARPRDMNDVPGCSTDK